MAATKIGHGLAKVLGIKLNYRDELGDQIRRGESVFSSHTADTYVEEEPTSGEWIRETLPSGPELVQYTRSLFPFLNWIGSYNLQWFAGDLVAGEHSPNTLRLFGMLIVNRYYYWSCSRASGNGLRHPCWPSRAIWIVYIFHGCSHLLVLCNFEGYHYRCRS